jgi:hypothetical protein
MNKHASKTATFGQKHYVWRGLFCSAFVQKSQNLIFFRNPSNLNGDFGGFGSFGCSFCSGV